MDPRDVIATLIAGRPLDEAGAEALFECILKGEAEPGQIAAILSLLQRNGVTEDELVGAARAMRRHVTRVPLERDRLGAGAVVLDTCGTGGAAKTFNISTAAAIVTAAAAPGRAIVAKHGNRSRTGRGSAEALRALGVNVDATPETQARCLQEAGICFCFAIHHHPAMRHAAGPRAALGVPTIFNLLGPLTNPAGATRQVLGVYRPEFTGLVAGALVRLGSERALVVHSDDGLDEVSPGAPSRGSWVEDGAVHTLVIEPGTLGASTTLDEIRAETLDEAVAMLRGALSGESRGPTRAVALNAGVALLVAGVVGTLEEGVARAMETIRRGDAMRALQRLVEVSNASV